MKKLLLTLSMLTISVNVFCMKQEIQILQKIKGAHFSKISTNKYQQIEVPFKSRVKIKNGYANMNFYARRIDLRDTDYPVLIEGVIYTGTSKEILLSKKDLLKPELKDLYIAILEKIKVKTKDKKIEKKVSELIKKYKAQKPKIIKEEKLYDATVITEN